MRSVKTLVVVAMLGFGARAHADPSPRCGSRFRTAIVELAAASHDADQYRSAARFADRAERHHFRTIAAIARYRAERAHAAETSTARVALRTLFGPCTSS